MSEPILRASGLTARYGSTVVFHDLSFSLHAGEMVALIGPNGSGKTTLLHSLCGIHREMQGRVDLAGRALTVLSRREIARRIALVAQSVQIDFRVTVADTVALGRYPWLGPMSPQRAEDERVIEEAIEALDLGALRSRALQTLSGGERQRVFVARALAQGTPLLFLDEPAASLDLRYQQEIFGKLRELARRRGVGVLVADHHLNLVAATCDRLLVLHARSLWAAGPPEEIVTERMISTVFGARMRVERNHGGRPQCVWDF